MLLSIVLPVYNVEKYIAECLDSCFAQDIPSEEYEIICVNDGSTDNSAEILSEYEKKHDNILIITQKNAGVSVARNTGANAAKGDYIWFVDPDDFIQENIFAFLKNQVSQNTPDIIRFKFYIFSQQLTKEEIEKKRHHELLPNSPLSVPSCMWISRHFILQSGVMWHPGIEQGEDSIYIRELMLHSPKETKIDKAFYFYRQQPASTTYRKPTNQARRLHSHIEGANIMHQIYLSPGGQCEANANILMDFLTRAMIIIARESTPQIKEEFALLKEYGLFPFKKPAECTKKSAFVTTRTDVVGKIFNYLCLRSHTRFGFHALRLWYMMYGFFHRLIGQEN